MSYVLQSDQVVLQSDADGIIIDSRGGGSINIVAQSAGSLSNPDAQITIRGNTDNDITLAVPGSSTVGIAFTGNRFAMTRDDTGIAGVFGVGANISTVLEANSLGLAFRNKGTSQFDDTVTFNGNVAFTQPLNITPDVTVDNLTVTGTLTLPAPVGVTLATYYVDSQRGSDVDGDGGILAPFATITAAIAAIEALTPSPFPTTTMGQFMIQVAAGLYVETPTITRTNISINGPEDGVVTLYGRLLIIISNPFGSPVVAQPIEINNIVFASPLTGSTYALLEVGSSAGTLFPYALQCRQCTFLRTRSSPAVGYTTSDGWCWLYPCLTANTATFVNCTFADTSNLGGSEVLTELMHCEGTSVVLQECTMSKTTNNATIPLFDVLSTATILMNGGQLSGRVVMRSAASTQLFTGMNTLQNMRILTPTATTPIWLEGSGHVSLLNIQVEVSSGSITAVVNGAASSAQTLSFTNVVVSAAIANTANLIAGSNIPSVMTLTMKPVTLQGDMFFDKRSRLAVPTFTTANTPSTTNLPKGTIGYDETTFDFILYDADNGGWRNISSPLVPDGSGNYYLPGATTSLGIGGVPTQRLTITDTTTNILAMNFIRTDATLTMGFEIDGTYGGYSYIRSAGSAALPFVLTTTVPFTGSGGLYMASGSGYIGIGVISPTCTLDVTGGTIKAALLETTVLLIQNAATGAGEDAAVVVKQETLDPLNYALYSWQKGPTLTGFGSEFRMNYDGSMDLVKVLEAGVLGENTIFHVAPTTNYVGIGTTTVSERLTVNGTVLATKFQTVSDARLKDNLEQIDGTTALERVMAMQGYRYRFKPTGETHIGYLAQDLQQIGLPEVVSEGKDEEKMLSVAYGNMVPILTEAIKEQQKMIAELQKKIDDLSSLEEDNGSTLRRGGAMCALM
jgi:hypothetical protein